MNRKLIFTLVAIAGALAVMRLLLTVSCIEQERYDPHTILDRYVLAIGGVELLRSRGCSHSRANLEYQGRPDTIELSYWQGDGTRSLYKYKYPDSIVLTGDNGKFEWEIVEGHVEYDTKKEGVLERRVDSLYEECEFLNRSSRYITASYKKTVAMGDTVCYLIKMSNSLNEELRLYLIDTVSYMLFVETIIEPEHQITVYYTDFQEKDGRVYPAQTRIARVSQHALDIHDCDRCGICPRLCGQPIRS